MVSRTKGTTDPNVSSLIYALRKAANANEAQIWRAISKKLKKPRRLRSEVNVSKVARHTEVGHIVLVPGKVLGAGEIGHSVTVAALTFSNAARTKIEAANGRTISITELIKENPKGSAVRILG